MTFKISIKNFCSSKKKKKKKNKVEYLYCHCFKVMARPKHNVDRLRGLIIFSEPADGKCSSAKEHERN